jgi:hypothetical protein
MQVDERVYRESSGATVVLDPDAARHVAAEYLAGQRQDLAATIAVESTRVVVQVRREASTSFLTVAGIESIHISAIAIAEVRHGIEQGEP